MRSNSSMVATRRPLSGCLTNTGSTVEKKSKSMSSLASHAMHTLDPSPATYTIGAKSLSLSLCASAPSRQASTVSAAADFGDRVILHRSSLKQRLRGSR